MEKCLKLNQIFKDDNDFAWRLLEAEAAVHVKKSINMIDITTLSELYMKAVERLNSVHDVREKFFQQKMQKFMCEPYVIRCFSNLNQGKGCELECKRKEIEQKISMQNEKKHPERLQQILSQHGQKQKRMKKKIDQILQDHQKTLQQRIKKRKAHKQDRSLIEDLESSNNKNSKAVKNGQNDQNDKIIKVQPFSASNSRVTKCTSSDRVEMNSP